MSKHFQDIQKEFAAHIRNPDKNAAPSEIEARRMKIYSNLFYNNVESFVSRAYPVLGKIYGEEKWQAMVKDFFENHACSSPYFSDIAKEFLEFLQTDRDLSQDPPFLVELAHYEWVELALEISQEEIPSTGFNPEGKLLHSQIVVSPLAWTLQYQWPVHQIGPDFQPESSEQVYFLLVYRNALDQIKFMELNAITARLLSIIQENPLFTGTNAIEFLSEELLSQGIENLPLELLMEKGEEALNHLRQQGIILGTRLESIENN